MAKDKPVDRRRFFRAALGEVFKPLSKAVAPIERAAEHLGKMTELDKATRPVPPRASPPPAQTSAPTSVPKPASPVAYESDTPYPPRRLALRMGACLRPPGALAEGPFVETCSRCGDCVRAC